MIEVEPVDGPERALLVALETPEDSRSRIDESLKELGELVRSAGGVVVDQVVQRLERPTAPFYIGKGKAEEAAKLVKRHNIQSIVFDDELSPAQARNLEKLFTKKVLDRTQLILDIFAQRARTREGKLQIELAQLQYLLPRLTRMWTHLSRQSGGIGTRGPGETQLEVDRRRVQERLARLERDLEEVRKHRTIQREGRRRNHWPICALVGYTNAGKSTLLNRLTDSDIYAADQLFATLDPTVRSFYLPNQQQVLLTDTVGFLQKLPHHLVDSFRATLEEVQEADVLIHVVDSSYPLFKDQMEAVEQVLKQLGADAKQTLLVFNKIDRLELSGNIERTIQEYPHAVAVSALSGQGIDQLHAELEGMLRAWRMEMRLRIPQSESALIAELYRTGRVTAVTYEANDAILTAHIPPMLQGKVKPYIVAEREPDPRTPRRRKAARAVVEPGG
ncbi:MAG: GTPase HflX [Candidatus Methylacidiphilales bacterium]|nr:GTPase HflX [Candidatus Methylacidiphilales bacterium]